MFLEKIIRKIPYVRRPFFQQRDLLAAELELALKKLEHALKGRDHDAKQTLQAADAMAQKLGEDGLKFATEPTIYNGVKQKSAFGLPELGEKFRPTKRMHNYLLRYDHVFG